MFSYKLDDETDIRLLELRHAEALFAVVEENREHLREWLSWVDTTLAADDTRNFIRTALDQFAAGNGFHAGIWQRGAIVGTIGVHPIDWLNRSAEIGYWLAASAVGRGLVTRAATALIDFAFAEWELNRITICCAASNRRSCAIPERLGFRKEATLRAAHWRAGHFEDLNVYALLRDEWQSRSDGH